ncbi:isoleucine--tRNA ligase [Aureivirga sp. CE67]|uniref:isoleucine--tRNA ligase n=1 Tax=Aureivirga sp. CE67 TaxID=1788983 RepID=UPI0018C9898C|nr:isoleucine--tRNA ligase [Aureivirga sp. CE67]
MSAKYKEYKGLNLVQAAEEVADFWKTNNIFEKSITSREDNEPFVFFEGPPSANGLPGIHHVMARTIKDIFCRYKTLKGYQVKRKAGWDTHGLPVELGVEKELKITKEDIGTKISVEEYNDACRKAVMRYTDVWNNLTERIGYWVDMEDPYVTYKPKYMESVWWLLAQLYKKDLIYKGYTIQPYSPKAGTGLSSHELNQPGCYKDVTDTTIVAQFKAVKETLPEIFANVDGDVHFLAWTTTPWTLPSNTALTVGKKIDYVLVKSFNQYTGKEINVILAKNLVGKQFGKKFFVVEDVAELANFNKGDNKIPYFIAKEFKGADVLGVKYEQLLPYAQPYENADKAFVVIPGDFVTTEDGTGIVHTAPTFGQDDAQVAKDAGVPAMLVLDAHENPVPLVDLQGKFTEHMGPYAGKYVKNEYYNANEVPEKSVDVEIAIQLKEENKAFHVEKYKHSYPHCWRTDKPVLYYPLDSWFIKVTDKKDRMFDLNETINWKPKSTGEGRFGNWLKNANDWNLSRSRYWGIPLPIWRTEDGTEAIIIESVAELKVEIEKSMAAGYMDTNVFADYEIGNMSDENYENIDLHKNIVDAVILVSPSGKPMKREADLIDVWFDSGSMPYAQWHYPFENKELIDNKESFPADFIAEGVDQTRGWFYTLHAIGTMVFDSVAYKNVVSNGLVLDKSGQKMSKSKGNAVDAFETLDKYGPDATRWYMISNANPWDNLKFDVDGIDEVRRKFFGTLYNTYSFFSLYANLDGFTYAEDDIPTTERPEIDRWILSELHTLIQDVDKFYKEYEPTRATRAIQDFVTENLSNWFVRLSRRRFWKGEYGTDKISAYQTLYKCMVTVAKLASPVSPFFTDRLYKDLTSVTGKDNVESVHLAKFPEFDASMVDKSLERKMQKAQKISSMVLSLRKKENLKVRQPLQKIMIPILDVNDKEDILAIQDLVLSEVNVKEIDLLEDASGILVKNIKPNFKVLGPKFGKNMKLISAEINKFSQEDIAEIEKNGSISIKINEELVTLGKDDVEISSQDIEGWLVASHNNITVALDITITETLKNEGIARELVNRIQNLRKDSGLEVTDKVTLTIKENEMLTQAISEYEDYIKTETQTVSIDFNSEVGNGTDVEFDEIQTEIAIQKI